MISPFTLYLILMLDNIKDAFVPVVLVAALMTIIGFVMMMANGDQGYDAEKRYFGYGKFTLKTAAPVLLFGVLGLALIPNTKQAAVIFIIPAIANNETVQREAHELYDLAKQGLKTLVTPDEPAKKEAQ